jgi:hypothetical protein
VRPNADVRIGSESAVGHFQHDPKHVQALEEVITCEREAMKETDEVEEEGITPEPGEEAVVAVGRHVRGRPERDRRVLDHAPRLVIVFGPIRAILASNIRELVSVLLLRKPY